MTYGTATYSKPDSGEQGARGQVAGGVSQSKQVELPVPGAIVIAEQINPVERVRLQGGCEAEGVLGE